MKRIYFSFVAFFALVVFFNCKKSNSTSVPADSPSVIQIDHPTTSAVYINSFPILVDGTITDPDNLTTVKVEIKNKTTNATLYQQTANTGTVSFYRFNWSYTLTGITTTTPGSVKITTTDKLGYEVSKEINITLDN
jgi:hypothetical protein